MDLCWICAGSLYKFWFIVSGDTNANCEVHLNLEELLELQQKREPVSPFNCFNHEYFKMVLLNDWNSSGTSTVDC